MQATFVRSLRRVRPRLVGTRVTCLLCAFLGRRATLETDLRSTGRWRMLEEGEMSDHLSA